MSKRQTSSKLDRKTLIGMIARLRASLGVAKWHTQGLLSPEEIDDLRVKISDLLSKTSFDLDESDAAEDGGFEDSWF